MAWCEACAQDELVVRWVTVTTGAGLRIRTQRERFCGCSNELREIVQVRMLAR